MRVSILAMGILKFIRNPRGFSIIEVLITVSIMSMMAMGIATLVVNATKDQRAIQEKFAMLEVQNSVLSSFSNSATCLQQLTGGAPTHLNLDAAAIATTSMPLSEIRAGILPTSPLLAKTGQPLPGYVGNQMIVSSMNFQNIEPTGNPNEYNGYIEIMLDPASMIRPMKPIRIRQLFTARPDPSASSSLIEDCQSSGGKKMGDWQVRPSGVVILATEDGFLAVTSAVNRGLIISTQKSAAGSCVGVPLTPRIQVAARDKYGQGVEQATLPIKSGECYKVQTINVHGTITGELAQIYFRAIN